MTTDIKPTFSESSPTVESEPLPRVNYSRDQYQLLRLPEVLRLIPVARSTWLGWVAAGIAPAPVRLGRTTAWLYGDLVTLIEQCVDRVTHK